MPPVRTRAGRAIRPRRSPSPVELRDDHEAPPARRNNTIQRLDELSARLDGLADLAARVDGFNDKVTQLTDVLAELQQHLAEHPNATADAALAPPNLRSQPIPGNAPLREHLESNYAYVDDSTKTLIVSGTLDAAHLVKLIRPSLRPKSSNAALTGNHLSFNLDTLQPSLSTDSAAYTALKHFPDFHLYAQALTVYAAIRDLYDLDHSGYAAAIRLHLHLLATWTRQNLGWPGILNYAIAFFIKNQRAPPLAWAEQDVILYNTHITVYTQTHPPSVNARIPGTPATSTARPSPSETICINFNKQNKGCQWDRCLRKHICSTCRQSNHPAYLCTSSPSQPHPSITRSGPTNTAPTTSK